MVCNADRDLGTADLEDRSLAAALVPPGEEKCRPYALPVLELVMEFRIQSQPPENLASPAGLPLHMRASEICAKNPRWSESRCASRAFRQSRLLSDFIEDLALEVLDFQHCMLRRYRFHRNHLLSVAVIRTTILS